MIFVDRVHILVQNNLGAVQRLLGYALKLRRGVEYSMPVA